MKYRKRKAETVYLTLEHWKFGKTSTPRLVTRRRNGQFVDNMSVGQMRTVGIKGVK